jgi:phenylpropionate dioxygenase-like ring-hydroxylating dioxygenase large terminal subunit
MIGELVRAQREGWSLDRDFYTSPEIHELDVERVFMRSWLYAGHAGEIPEPGDFFLYPIANESIIVIRGEDGAVHALFNVCRHRGSAVCLEPRGRKTRLVCPYHQWVYRTDGTLAQARLMPDLPKEEFGLVRAKVRVVEGLIFIHLSDGDSFDGFEREIGARLRVYDLPRAKIAHETEYEVRANWKLVLENSRECYHCGKGHPQYCKAVGFAAAVDSDRAAEEDVRRSAERESRLKSMGFVTEPLAYSPGSWYHSRRFALREGFFTESMDGRPVAPLLGSIPDRDVGGMALVVLPNLLLEASGDYVMTLRFTAATPTTTRAKVQWLVRGDAVEGKDYDIARLTEFWKLTCEQDWKLCEDNQTGVNSRRYQPGPYAPDEKGVKHFVQWYLGRLAP